MPLRTPVLDDRNFEQLLLEAKNRIGSFTPEWTNYAGESDPGITIVELFAFVTDNLLYRSNRVPELNRLKFLQLLGIPLRPASPSEGIVTILNDRGPMESRLVDRGTIVSAGSVDFVMQDPVDVLPVEGQVYYKRPIPSTDPNYDTYSARYEAIRVAAEAAAEAERSTSSQPTAAGTTKLAFYETAPLPQPTPAAPDSGAIDLSTDAAGGALYLALLAPPKVDPALVRPVIANHTLSVCIVPPQDGRVQPLLPLATTTSAPGLIYEIANVGAAADRAVYSRLRTYAAPDVLNAPGVVQLQLPAVDQLRTWQYSDPLQEGTGDFPPRITDDEQRGRLITWIRIRQAPSASSQPGSTGQSGSTGPSTAISQSASGGGSGSNATQVVKSSTSLQARITWVGVNASRVYQAVPVVNEIVGTVAGASIAPGVAGEPDQTFFLAHRNVLPSSIQLLLQDTNAPSDPPQQWRLVPLEDLLTARPSDNVFAIDAEAGQIRFGDGIRGARPLSGWRIVASYQYGGGVQGNVGIGAIKASREPTLQGSFKIGNPLPTTGGAAAQSVAQGERSVPLVLRHKDRLVTSADFHDIALETPGAGVGRAEVLPLFLPGNPDREDASGVVTVMVVPGTDVVNPLWPTPDRAFLRRVCNYLDPRRLVTSEVHVEGPRYRSVYLSVGIATRPGFFADIVRTNVTNALQVYLSALPPGGPYGGGWPLGRQLLKKDIEAVATRVAGVDYVDSMEMGVESPIDIDSHALSGLELPRVAGISVGEGPAEPLAGLFGTNPAPPADTVIPIPVGPETC